MVWWLLPSPLMVVATSGNCRRDRSRPVMPVTNFGPKKSSRLPVTETRFKKTKKTRFENTSSGDSGDCHRFTCIYAVFRSGVAGVFHHFTLKNIGKKAGVFETRFFLFFDQKNGF